MKVKEERSNQHYMAFWRRPILLEADFIKKRLITRIGSRVPVPKRMGEFGSSLHRSGYIYASGGETRCSAVWSAHLFWVQRAIGSNPVTLM